MSINKEKIWEEIRDSLADYVDQEPLLTRWLSPLLIAESIEELLADMLSSKFACQAIELSELKHLLLTALDENPELTKLILSDLEAVKERDAACHSLLEPLLFFKGFQSLVIHRFAHHWYQQKRTILAFFLQSRCSEIFGVDIHPAAQLGKSIMMDHATGVVIGETAIVEDDVSILHEVTLGGTGKEDGLRHPVVRRGVMIGAGSKILGRVIIGKHSKIGAGSVVIKDVESYSTVAGVPAKVVGKHDQRLPSSTMDQNFSI